VFEDRGGLLRKEAKALELRAKAIRIPKKGGEVLAAEYFVHRPTMKFGNVDLVPESRRAHSGSPTWRAKVFDLSAPRSLAPYDKFGCKALVGLVKFHLFGSKSYRMTKERCEQFFEDDQNFDFDGLTID